MTKPEPEFLDDDEVKPAVETRGGDRPSDYVFKLVSVPKSEAVYLQVTDNEEEPE